MSHVWDCDNDRELFSSSRTGCNPSKQPVTQQQDICSFSRRDIWPLRSPAGLANNVIQAVGCGCVYQREHVRYWHEEAAANISHRCIPWTLANLVSDRQECRGFTHREAGGTGLLLLLLLLLIHKRDWGMTARTKETEDTNKQPVTLQQRENGSWSIKIIIIYSWACALTLHQISLM